MKKLQLILIALVIAAGLKDFVGAASTRSSLFVTFARLGYTMHTGYPATMHNVGRTASAVLISEGPRIVRAFF